MKRTILLLAALVIVGLPVSALAGSFTYNAPATGANQGSGGANQFNLDHTQAYTWRIDNVNLGGQTITGATLTFRNISNWDANQNMLFVHLLDTARNAGVNSFADGSGTSTAIADNFAGSLYNSNPLVNAGTANTLLTSHSFSTTPSTFVYTFTAAQLQALNAYFQNGNNIAFGFDPDCHFWNNGITFNFTTTPTNVPEPMTLTLLGTGLIGLYAKRRRSRSAAKI